MCEPYWKDVSLLTGHDLLTIYHDYLCMNTALEFISEDSSQLVFIFLYRIHDLLSVESASLSS